MKWSNSALALVAAFTLGLSAYLMVPVVTATPTAVISIANESNNSVGGGMSIKLPKDLSPHQAQLLTMAYEIAKEDGHKQPQLLQGILLQETKAGKMASYKVAGQEFGLKTNERYYGLFQIKLAAAKDAMKAYPEIRKEFNFQTNTDEEIIAKLIENERFNTSIASKYLLVLKKAGYDTIAQLSAAFNQGAGGARDVDPSTFHYSQGVMRHIQKLKGNT